MGECKGCGGTVDRALKHVEALGMRFCDVDCARIWLEEQTFEVVGGVKMRLSEVE
jgi:hypothetical protein